MRAFLDEAFERLALLDPERHVRLATARYPLDSIIAGVAIFESKQRRGSLPDGVDARYLLGIVRNVHEQREGELIAETLLRLRRQARDIALERVVREHDALQGAKRSTHEMLGVLTDRALLADRALDRSFWLDALAGYVAAAPTTNATLATVPLLAASTLRFARSPAVVNTRSVCSPNASCPSRKILQATPTSHWMTCLAHTS